MGLNYFSLSFFGNVRIGALPSRLGGGGVVGLTLLYGVLGIITRGAGLVMIGVR